MKFIKVIKSEEQIHKVPFEAENAAECAKQLVKNFELYNHFSSEVSLGDMIETKDGNRFVVQDVMDFADKYEKEMKKESAIQQPNKPKPTTMLPDNMEWAWDPDAADWVAVLKDNANTTPPLYDPNNQNVVNQTTSYMSTVKSSCLSKFLDGPQFSKEIKIEAGLIKEGLVKYAGFDFNRGTKYAITTKGLEVLRNASEAEHNEALNEREKLAYLFGFNTDEVSTLDTTGKVIKSEEETCELCKEVFEKSELVDTELGKICHRCKRGIESKEGPFKKQFSICEADGSELGKVTASSQLDALVKFGIEHPEYADSQSISAKQVYADENAVETTYVSVKELKSFLRQNGAQEVNFGTFVSDIKPSGLVKKMVAHGTKKIRLTYDEYKLDVYSNGARLIENLAVYDGNWKDKYYKFSNPIGGKEIDSKYEETTEQHLDYPNPSETPTTDVILENHDGWVNTANKK